MFHQILVYGTLYIELRKNLDEHLLEIQIKKQAFCVEWTEKIIFLEINTTMRSFLWIFGKLFFVELCSAMLGSRYLKTNFLGCAKKYLRPLV